MLDCGEPASPSSAMNADASAIRFGTSTTPSAWWNLSTFRGCHQNALRALPGPPGAGSGRRSASRCGASYAANSLGQREHRRHGDLRPACSLTSTRALPCFVRLEVSDDKPASGEILDEGDGA